MPTVEKSAIPAWPQSCWSHFKLFFFFFFICWKLFKCATFPPIYFALLQCYFSWMENFPRVVFFLPFQRTVWHLLASVRKMCLRVQRGAHIHPFLKSTQGCTFLAQSALSKLLPLSNGKGHITESFRRTSSPASLFWVLQKKRNRKYLDGSNGQQEHLILLNKDRRCLSRTCFLLRKLSP